MTLIELESTAVSQNEFQGLSKGQILLVVLSPMTSNAMKGATDLCNLCNTMTSMNHVEHFVYCLSPTLVKGCKMELTCHSEFFSSSVALDDGVKNVEKRMKIQI